MQPTTTIRSLAALTRSSHMGKMKPLHSMTQTPTPVDPSTIDFDSGAASTSPSLVVADPHTLPPPRRPRHPIHPRAPRPCTCRFHTTGLARTGVMSPTSPDHPHQLIQSIQAAADLHDRGHLSPDEFQVLKQSVMLPVSPGRAAAGGGPTAADLAAAVVAGVATPAQARTVRQTQPQVHRSPATCLPPALFRPRASPARMLSAPPSLVAFHFFFFHSLGLSIDARNLIFDHGPPPRRWWHW